MNIDELAKQHENDHPGYRLADWYEAAFPSYEVYLRVLMQVEQPLPATDQFVLRALEMGIRSVLEICQVLGLEETIVVDAMGRLQLLGFVVVAQVKATNGRKELINITTKGQRILQQLAFMRPEEETFNLCLDALTGEYYPHRSLRTVKSVSSADLFQIQSYQPEPECDQLDVVGLRRVWKETRRSRSPEEGKKELLDVLAVDNAYIGYRQMRVLQYVRPADGVVLVQVYDGVDRSQRHEAELLKMEDEGIRTLRVEKLSGPEHGDDPVAEVIGPELFEAAKRKAAEVPVLEEEIAKLAQQIEESEELGRTSRIEEDQQQSVQRVTHLHEEIGQLKERIEELEDAAPAVEVLSMAEHRPKLLQALHDAQDKVIIISPWLTPTAVNRELLDLIAETVKRGVQIWIGHGFGDADYRERKVLKKFERVQKQRGGSHLHLCRLEDIHSKVVICDREYMITTSFNWLSFAGREDWGNRHETGTLTREPAAVREMLKYWMPLLYNSEAVQA